MNDGMYTNIRNYLEEIASQQKQILAAVQRTNELLAVRPQNVYSRDVVDPQRVAEQVEVAAPKPATKPAGPVEVKGAVEVMPKADHPDFTVTVEDEQKPTPATKTATKKPAKAKPAVNWNS